MGTNAQVAKFQEQPNIVMEDIRSQLTKLTQNLSIREPGRFPSQPNPNPIKQTNQVEATSNELSSHEQVQAITVLKSGKIIEKPDDDPRTSQPTQEEKLIEPALEENHEKKSKR